MVGEFAVSDLQLQRAIEDEAVDDYANPRLVTLNLRVSKTDQVGKGACISLAINNSDLCPVAALLASVPWLWAHYSWSPVVPP